MLEVAISLAVKRASILSVRLIFFTRLATSGGKCDTNGDTEDLLLAMLRLEYCLGVVTVIVRISGDQSRVCKDKVFSTGACRFMNSLLATTTKSRLDC